MAFEETLTKRSKERRTPAANDSDDDNDSFQLPSWLLNRSNDSPTFKKRLGVLFDPEGIQASVRPDIRYDLLGKSMSGMAKLSELKNEMLYLS